MTHLLHLAQPTDLDRLLPMVGQFHASEGLQTTEDDRRSALTPLLDGSPHGAIWLIGPKMSPVGYVAIAFGWSIELGGLEATVDELWIREKVRGRGMGGEAMATLLKTLEQAGVAALHLEVSPDNKRAEGLYQRLGFERRPYSLMTWRTRGPISGS